MEIKLKKLQVIALFMVVFVVVGYTAPILHLTYSPEDNFVEEHSFTASDTYVNAESHTLCFNRTVHRPTDAEITVERILIKDDGSIIEEQSFVVQAYYQKGQQEVIITRDIDERLTAGEYKYIESVELTYYNGQVKKRLTFETDNFKVYESQKKFLNASDPDCEMGNQNT
jgi:hypothetical protein